VAGSKEGLVVMNPPAVQTKNESVQQQEAQEKKRREENARKAKEAADHLFPGETWQPLEAGIFLSSRRPVGKKTNFAAEKKDVEILKSFSGTIYFVPEARSAPGKKYDAIVNGQKMEFKNIHGTNVKTL
jgi:hypothetical protein